MRSRLLAATLITLITIVPVAGCAGPAPAPTATAQPAPTLDVLSNSEYVSDITPSKKAKLVSGKHEEAAAPGSASKVTVALFTPAFGTGDLNGDGAPDAAAVLASSGGGSGTFISLHAMVNDKGAVKDAGWVNLGDRVQVKAVAISGGVITVNMVKHGPNDPQCCPTQEATVKYKLQDGKLVAQ